VIPTRVCGAPIGGDILEHGGDTILTVTGMM
jgi:hypothetical protein